MDVLLPWIVCLSLLGAFCGGVVIYTHRKARTSPNTFAVSWGTASFRLGDRVWLDLVTAHEARVVDVYPGGYVVEKDWWNIYRSKHVVTGNQLRPRETLIADEKEVR